MTSVEETLAAAAQASAAAAEAKPKKERVKKDDAGIGSAPKAAKEPKAPKEPKVTKTYPQANEDGTQKFEEDGTTPVMGPRATQYKAPKAPRQSQGKYPGTAVITLLAEKNPKREGSASHARFAAYKTGITVAEALAAGLTTGDFHHDVAHNFIRIEVGVEFGVES